MNVQAELRFLKARVAALEAAEAARRRKRPAAPKPSDAIITERYELWAKYIRLEMRFGHGRCRLTKLAFAMRWRLNPTEFCRWFSASDRRGIPEGSGPDRSFRRELNAAIAELEARGKNQFDGVKLNSHGNMLHSQDSGARLQ